MDLSRRHPPSAQVGALLLALALLRAVTLRQGLGSDRLAVALCLLLLASLALALLFREGRGPTELAVLLLPIGLGLFVRAMFLDHATLDYQDFLHPWVEHFRTHGGFAALKDPVGNYNVPYLYLLALLSYLPIPDLYGIKLFSILADVLLAWGGFRLARRLSSDRRAPLLAFSALFLLPTVILNGSAWGQCDSIWTALCVHALVSALEEHPKTSLALLALAFSFKLQAIFILPLWCALWVTGRIKGKYLPVFPAVFLLSMVPALLAGRPLGDILSVYLNQTTDSVSHHTLNYNSPSVFAFLPYGAEPGPWAAKGAIAAAFLLVLILLGLLLWRRRDADDAVLILAGAALALGVPFLLPYMHERYFFLGVVLLVVLACADPVHLPAAAGSELASLGGYHAYLLNRYAMVLHVFGMTLTQPLEGLLMLGAVLWTAYALWRQLHKA